MGCAALTLLDRLGNVLEVVLFALVVRRDGRRCPGLAIGAKLRININIYELVSPDGNVFALLLSLHVPCALCSANASTLRTGNRQRTIAALVIQPTQQSAMQKEAKSVAPDNPAHGRDAIAASSLSGPSECSRTA